MTAARRKETPMLKFAIPASSLGTTGAALELARTVGTALGSATPAGQPAPAAPAAPSSDINLLKVEVNIGTGR